MIRLSTSMQMRIKFTSHVTTISAVSFAFPKASSRGPAYFSRPSSLCTKNETTHPDCSALRRRAWGNRLGRRRVESLWYLNIISFCNMVGGPLEAEPRLDATPRKGTARYDVIQLSPGSGVSVGYSQLRFSFNCNLLHTPQGD